MTSHDTTHDAREINDNRKTYNSRNTITDLNNTLKYMNEHITDLVM